MSSDQTTRARNRDVLARVSTHHINLIFNIFWLETLKNSIDSENAMPNLTFRIVELFDKIKWH
jgi:hypothetical protein